MAEFRVSFWGVPKSGPKGAKARPVLQKVEAETKEDVLGRLSESYDKIKGLKVNPAGYSLYDALVKVMAPKEIDHHESDLYVLRDEKSIPIVEGYAGSHSIFTSNVDHKLWYDIPFAYKPFWDKVSARSGALTEAAQAMIPGGMPKTSRPRLSR